MADDRTVKVSDRTHNQLFRRKLSPDETFDDVIQRLLDPESSDPHESPKWLFWQYTELEKPVTRIADEAGTDNQTIIDLLEKYDIPR